MREYRLIDGQRFLLEDQVGFNVRPYTKKVVFKPGERLLDEGAKTQYLYFLEKGRAKVTRCEKNGRETLANFLTAPAFIGEMELLGARDYTNAVTAITACTCYRICCTHCKEQLLNDPKFLRSLCMDLLMRFVKEADAFSKNLSYPLEPRLAHFILQSSVGDLYCIKHTEAAAYLGVSYRHFLYVLAKYVQEGLIEKAEHGYRILDRNGLNALSDSTV